MGTFLEATPARRPIYRFGLAIAQTVNTGCMTETPWPSTHTKQAKKCAWTLVLARQVLAHVSLTTLAAQAVSGRRKSGRSTKLLQRHTSMCIPLENGPFASMWRSRLVGV